ncbi:MAG: right-handed parallel beta-helix repeat-containing protein, partial [Pirellulales bacterium]
MMRYYRAILLMAASAGMFLPVNRDVLAEGRFLRGQRWQPFAVDGNEVDFYVAPDGNDTWSGTVPAPNRQKTDGPFATIGRAQEAVRELKTFVYKDKQEPIEKRWIGSPHKFGEGRDIVVLVRGGTYLLREPLTFAPEDGGERCETNLPSGAFEYHKLKDYFVTYAAYPGETPVFSGGARVGPWAKEDRLWVTSVEGVKAEGFVVNGRSQRLARTPNDGYYTAPEMTPSTRAFRFRPGQLRAWPDMEENRIVMLLRWHTGMNSIARIDEQQRTAHLREPQKGIRVVPPRYYVENVLALLDAPGEWFFDRRTNRLSYLPASGLQDPNSARTIVPVLSRLMAVEGRPGKPVRNLRVYGLEFEAAVAGGHAVSFQYAHRCELVGATVRAVGGIGVYVGKGCYHNRILENRVLQADRGGIAVEGNPHPDKWFDIVRETVVSHNFVADCGGRSISATNCLDTVIAHNEVTRNRGRTAIKVGGWSNLEEAIDGGYRVQFNHVHHVQQQADDSGAITTAGLTYDSVVRANLIHDVHAGFFNDNVAIWFDNMSSGWRAEDNIYYNLGQGQMKLCASNLVDNVYKNNTLIEPPANRPEGTIDGMPILEFGDVRTTSYEGEVKGS